MPKVSVLLPVFNGEKFLEEAIESVLNQTFTDFELIILDDGSTDRSVQIIESFSDPRIKLYRNGSNLKLIATLNKGLELASGFYIARMDSDDVCEPDRFEQQVAFMDANPDYVAVGSNCRLFGETNCDSDLRLNNDEIRVAIYFETPMVHPATMIRTSTIKKHLIQYRVEYLHIEDWAFWYDLLKVGKMANLEKKLLRYRISGSNISIVNRNSSEIRYKEFYRHILTPLLGVISESELDLHFQLSHGIYKKGTSRSMSTYVKHLRQALRLNGHDVGIIEMQLKKKCFKLTYQILDVSIRKGIYFALRHGVLRLSLVRYVFGKVKNKKSVKK